MVASLEDFRARYPQCPTYWEHGALQSREHCHIVEVCPFQWSDAIVEGPVVGRDAPQATTKKDDGFELDEEGFVPVEIADEAEDAR
jgi:hypothetical protein